MLGRDPGSFEGNVLRPDRYVAFHREAFSRTFIRTQIRQTLFDGHRDLESLRAGFCVVLNPTAEPSLRKTFDTTFSGVEGLDPLYLVTYLYLRFPPNPAELLNHFTFVVDGGPESRPLLWKALYQGRLFRWLKGRGYPPSFRNSGIVSPEEFRTGEGDPALRLRHLLHVTTGIPQLPSDPAWTVCTRLRHPSEGDVHLGSPIKFRTCFMAMDVRLDAEVKGVLTRVPDTPRGEAAFDSWFHKQLLNPVSHFNTG
ncbi:hypothetical protein AAF712_006440 [Marasmius tenuissimus]|uniref:Uncharacterized protein n=1 Tax=Marasmius tenuissimus TaxID=585030 RepID=A0ABR2ZY36_9AGAR